MDTQDPHSLSILVIEDNDMFLQLALEMLSGHRYEGAKNAKDGLEKFKTTHPDITFLDIGLPDGSGHDLLKQMHDIDPNAFVVMLTASNLQADVQQSLTKGAKGYIVKPFSRSQIKESLYRFKEHRKTLGGKN